MKAEGEGDYRIIFQNLLSQTILSLGADYLQGKRIMKRTRVLSLVNVTTLALIIFGVFFLSYGTFATFTSNEYFNFTDLSGGGGGFIYEGDYYKIIAEKDTYFNFNDRLVFIDYHPGQNFNGYGNDITIFIMSGSFRIFQTSAWDKSTFISPYAGMLHIIILTKLNISGVTRGTWYFEFNHVHNQVGNIIHQTLGSATLGTGTIVLIWFTVKRREITRQEKAE